jgi:hypothetical protein
MKKTTWLLLSMVLATSAMAGASAAPAFEAGFASRSINPPAEMMSKVWHVSRRRPTGVLPGDGIGAHAAYLAGERRLGVISLDVLGLFYDDIVDIRNEARARLGADLEVIVASTHTHASIDTLGIYGPDQATNGIYEPYLAFVRAQAVDALAAAAEAARPAVMRVGAKAAPAGLNEFDRNRHVGSMDDNVYALEFLDGSTSLGTIVNWTSHPELIDPKSSSDPGIPAAMRGSVISSDYVHTVRTTVTSATGAPVVFLNGAVGAVTALAVSIIDPDTGAPFPKRSVKKARYVGTRIGTTALEALEAGTTQTDPALAIDNLVFDLTVENPFVLALKVAGVVDRQTYAAGIPVPMGRDVRTEMIRVRLGSVEMLTIPGEMQPDLYTGGYLPAEEKANPDVPEEQPIAPQMTGDVRFVIGLGMDELGYFVSATDYSEPTYWPVYGEGEDRNGVDHYQETLSLGRDTARTISRYASLLLGTTPEDPYTPYIAGFLDATGRALYGTETGDVRGIWVDTSNSGRYERAEDTEAFTSIPSGAPAAYGYLDSQARDMGPTPANGARGVWVDGDGDGVFRADRDPHLFFDGYALGEGPIG